MGKTRTVKAKRGKRAVQRGRPTSLTRPLVDKIAGLISNGLRWSQACALVEVNQRTAEHWREKGRERPSSVYGYFEREIKKARVRFEAFHLKNINAAASSGEWTASAWSLERCYPDKYGRRVVEHKGKVRTEKALDLDTLTDAELDALAVLVAKAGGTTADTGGGK